MRDTPRPICVDDYVRRQVAAGFESSDAIDEHAMLLYGIDPDATCDLVTKALAARTAAAAGWPEVTDRDRLDRAFAHERAAARLAPGAIAPLAELGRSQEALALVGSALDRVAERADLLALAPAVLAVSADPRAAAAAMLEAWRAAEAGLDAMLCRDPVAG